MFSDNYQTGCVAFIMLLGMTSVSAPAEMHIRLMMVKLTTTHLRLT